jgi:arylsulfatase
MRTDRAEQHNLAAKMPDKVKELERGWQTLTDSFITLVRKTTRQTPVPKSKPRKN